MNTLNINKFGLAVGSAATMLHLGCILLMIIIGKAGTVKFFNTILHGIDVSSIIRMNITIWESALGLIVTFVIGWLFGAVTALIYNISLIKTKRKED